MKQERSWGLVRCCPVPFHPPGGLGRKPEVKSVTPDFLKAVTGVDDMACPQYSELSYAWEKYMDCRLQGADLQVGAAEDVMFLGFF